jgi:hypothetical protein
VSESVRRLIEDLAGAAIGATFNQYRDTGGDDAGPDAPRVRRENLFHYLDARRGAPVLLVAEAAGWRGARYSGLCLYCERQIDESNTPLRRTSRHPGGWSEPSATIVQRAIAPWAERVVLWNLVPTHPRRDAMPHTNRAPTLTELREGERWTRRLIDLLQPQHVAAIGRLAAAALTSDVPAVRHPAHGGATASTQQLRALLQQWLPSLSDATVPDVERGGTAHPKRDLSEASRSGLDCRASRERAAGPLRGSARVSRGAV